MFCSAYRQVRCQTGRTNTSRSCSGRSMTWTMILYPRSATYGATGQDYLCLLFADDKYSSTSSHCSSIFHVLLLGELLCQSFSFEMSCRLKALVMHETRSYLCKDIWPTWGLHLFYSIDQAGLYRLAKCPHRLVYGTSSHRHDLTLQWKDLVLTSLCSNTLK